MDLQNRLALYGSYFLGMAGIGFTLPYLPLFLQERGLSRGAIGVVSTLAAVAGLAQYPIGLLSDRLGRRKPLLLVLLALLAASTLLLAGAEGLVWLTVLTLLFAENGLCRATVESLAGAEAARLAEPGKVGTALGALRFWRPVSIIVAALGCGWLSSRYDFTTTLVVLAVVQGLAVAAGLLIHERREAPRQAAASSDAVGQARKSIWHDQALVLFLVAMVLFHTANAPSGVYLGLFMTADLGASRSVLPYAFVVSMVSWMAAVALAGRLSDGIGRKPLLVVGWTAMAVRPVLIAISGSANQVLVIQVLDGLAQALFAVAAAAWVTDRLADPARVGEAQVLVGSALVFGSAVGPLLAAPVVEWLGYRGLFIALAGVGAAATGVVVFVPESMPSAAARATEPAVVTG